jgi:FAD/FMN-containing dehydrogenase
LSNNSTVIAHAGDGNFHTVILFDPNQEDHRREAERLNHFMVHSALSMEGACCFLVSAISVLVGKRLWNS